MSDIFEIKKGEQPIYEVITREDLTGAFRDALEVAIREILARLDNFIEFYTLTETRALWVFELRNRLDYDYLL